VVIPAIILAGIIALAVATSGTSTTTTSAPAASSHPAATHHTPAPKVSKTTGLAPGSTVTFRGWGQAGSVTVTTSLASHSAVAYEPLPANGQYVIAHVVAKAAPGSSLDMNELDFYARTATGQHLDSDAGNALEAIDPAKALGSPTVNSGETVTGDVSFDVPAGHGTIVWAPAMTGQPQASWNY
jgi:hypothetical protein